MTKLTKEDKAGLDALIHVALTHVIPVKYGIGSKFIGFRVAKHMGLGWSDCQDTERNCERRAYVERRAIAIVRHDDSVNFENCSHKREARWTYVSDADLASRKREVKQRRFVENRAADAMKRVAKHFDIAVKDGYNSVSISYSDLIKLDSMLNK